MKNITFNLFRIFPLLEYCTLAFSIGGIIGDVASVAGYATGNPWIGTAVNAISGVLGAGASSDAASQQAAAAMQGNAVQQAMFNQTQANLQPYMAAGTGALNQLVAGTQPGGSLMPQSYTPYTLDMFRAGPESQIMSNQEAQALNASQNASSISGGPNSNNMKSLINWTQGNAVNQYNAGLQNYLTQFLTGNNATQQKFNNLNTLAGSGQNAAAGLGTVATNVGSNLASGLQAAGNANAAGTIGVANALSGGLGGAYNSYLQQQYMNPAISGYPSGGVGANAGAYSIDQNPYLNYTG